MKAETIAKALGGRKVGQGWTARCPAHDDRNLSLSIRDAGGKVLVRCHAGCDQRDVINALRARGLWEGQRYIRRHRHRRAVCKPEQSDPRSTKRSAIAFSVWEAAKPAAGSPVETNLASRGLKLPPSSAIRFHAGLKHPSGGVWSCMVALVTRGKDAAPTGIHRTFLARDGASKAQVEPAKMMLGPCRGGVVRLAEPSDLLMVGEGIGTSLAAMQATGNPAWAALSTSGLSALDLPADVGNVIVLADGDDAGEAAARDCARRWVSQGRHVRIARPPQGMDFNDMLLGRLSEVEGVAKRPSSCMQTTSPRFSMPSRMQRKSRTL